MGGRDLDYEIDRFAIRTIQQCITEAMSLYWVKRAEVLEAARSKPGDFIGRATVEEIAVRDAGLTLAATNCRNHARLLAEGTVSPWIAPDAEHAFEVA
ncbi:hypothetical protein [Kribbella catacumbae]|uniref:hypothetical protein n=1 Tax=Kribbella catacumbae TaxID=460086 RepID=UPI00037CFC69|nr:hypothetical protein [Kribbella catacumbae]